MLLTLLLLAAPPSPPKFAARAAELQTRARAHHEAREYMQAANTYVALSAIPGVDVDDALGRAHLDLEAAFAATRETIHLCRALRLARGRLVAASDEQKRLSWEETIAEDLEQLAEVGGEANCPPVPQPRVQLLAADDPPAAAAPRSTGAERSALAVDEAPPPAERRLRARRAAGMTLTGVGAGLVGLMGATLAGYRKGYDTIQAAGDKPEDFVYSADQEAALRRVYDDTALAKGLAIGLGVASAATLATGIGLLASHRRVARRMALLPTSVLRGGGLVVRLRF